MRLRRQGHEAAALSHPAPLLGPLEAGVQLCTWGDRRQVGTHLEVRELGESLLAARMWALVGSVACVDSAKAGAVRQ